jgi:hypothetical protein
MNRAVESSRDILNQLIVRSLSQWIDDQALLKTCNYCSALSCFWNGLTCVVFSEIETQRHRVSLSSRYNRNINVVLLGWSISGNQLLGDHPSQFISACNTCIGTGKCTSDRILDSIEENKYLNWLRIRNMRVTMANQFRCHENIPIYWLSVHKRRE